MPESPTPPEPAPQDWRSPCPIARSLEILGDRWTLLVIRDLYLGKTRFKEFVASPERIPTNILAERLERLRRHGLVRQAPEVEGGRRQAYTLTEKGQALLPVLKEMRDWGLEWVAGSEALRK